MQDFLGAASRALRDYLKTKMSTSLNAIYDEWPDANKPLKMPCVTILTTGSPEYAPCQPYPLSNEDIEDVQNNAANVKYVVGQFDLDMLLSFWCSTKQERQEIYAKFFDVFLPNIDNPGLQLVLNDYHGIRCSYVHTGYSFGDSEEGAQRREWRINVPLLVTCNAVVDRSVPIITQPIDPGLEIVDDPTEELEE